MHHANLLVGGLEWAYTVIPGAHQEISPDVSILEYARMNISDVRTVTHEASMRPMQHPYRVFIISCTSILGEAQNALLKLFEEPNAHTIFYFVIPRTDMLLPTLLSRFNILKVQERELISDEANEFLTATYRDRLLLIIKKIDEEDSKWIETVIKSLSEYAHTLKQPNLIRDVLFVETYMHIAGCSQKMLLEHIALTLPQKTKTVARNGF